MLQLPQGKDPCKQLPVPNLTAKAATWKGENVATTEVENFVSMLDFIEVANVFGVTVPQKTLPMRTHNLQGIGEDTVEVSVDLKLVRGSLYALGKEREENLSRLRSDMQRDHEGRIGMVSIKLKDGKMFDGDAMFSQVTEHLPNYARPRFVRIQDALPVTGTYKQYKMGLVNDGFNLTCIKDPLYFLDDTNRTYRPLDLKIYNDILGQKIKL
ncbi:unnamed protein product [Ranitomeya imitator]|uniref:long-chain-fatty-acid--CoA ligase n=1 Tax=Ranitomeya imitator TaxID=111125 RepID=A0ABN9L8Q0_9NEOB|nr:unnamed protein product [Ranitomeya imitator]